MSIWNGVLLWGLSLRELLAGACLLVGFFFIAISAIGVVRLPDFYSRLHASGMGETFGLLFSGLGLVIYECDFTNGFDIMIIKLIIVFLLVFLANPIGTHILGQAAYKSGLVPWEIEEKEAEENAESHH